MAMSGKSAAVTTAFTPGSASALEASIDTIRACACGLRLTLPHSMPGRRHVGAEGGAAGDLVDAVRADRTGADDFQLGFGNDVVHAALASPRISAAASITARMILS